MTTASRVAVTAQAAEMLRRLHAQHGPLMFHPQGEFATDGDVRVGDLTVEGLPDPVPVWMSAAQFAYWKHTHLTIDLVPGRGSGFSLEAPEGVRFLIRSRLPGKGGRVGSGYGDHQSG